MVSFEITDYIAQAYHRGGIFVSRIRIPLVHDHTGLAGKRTVVSRLARLVGAHSPTGVLRIRSDSDHVGIIGRELTLSSSLLKSRRLDG